MAILVTLLRLNIQQNSHSITQVSSLLQSVLSGSGVEVRE